MNYRALAKGLIEFKRECQLFIDFHQSPRPKTTREAASYKKRVKIAEKRIKNIDALLKTFPKDID